MHHITPLLAFLLSVVIANAQTPTVYDDFEGNGTITTWFGDDCEINTNLVNPFQQGENTSATVLEYNDNGGQFANVRFEAADNFDLSELSRFSMKIYVPSGGITGNQPNQVSLKLQDGSLGEPWSTQCEIIKPILLNQWQTVTFDFKNDVVFNLDPSSLPPTQRTDLNRVVIQVNGENNTDHVLAYIDDFLYDTTVYVGPVYNNLIWSDEFDEDGAIDGNKWFHQTQLPSGGSWFNGEIQHYTDRVDNAQVNNGILSVIAKKETYTSQGFTKNYTSARLNSKFAFQYGRVEVRAKLPMGVGTWPAIWMLGKNISEDGAYWETQGFGTTAWPECGEIDIMEHWGDNQNFVQSAIHTPSSFGATENKGGQIIPTASTEFHVYALEWTEEKLIFSVDDVVHYIYNPPVKNAETWPFDAEQYLILNIAIQPFIDPNFSSGSMDIDYVRIYQEGEASSTEITKNQDSIYYPNPVANILNIDLAETTDKDILLKIYDMEGQLIKTYIEPANKDKITLNDLGDLSKGVYLLTYEIGDRQYSLKFIKK